MLGKKEIIGLAVLGLGSTAAGYLYADWEKAQPKNTTTLTIQKNQTQLSTDPNHESVTTRVTNNYLSDNLNYEQ